MVLLEANNLTKKYKQFTLDDVSLTLEEGKIYGFVGENGSGKSTTMKAITGLIIPDSGEVKINNKDLKTLTPTEREDISFTLDELCFPEHLKVKSINQIFKRVFALRKEEMFLNYLKDFNIDINKKVKELSKGMKAKLNIAIALSHDAKILILDEPMNGLDPVARDEFCDLLIEFVKSGPKRVILISSHIISDLEKICNEFIFIHRGKILLKENKISLENNFLKITLSNEKFDSFDKNNVIRYKTTADGVEVLIKNNEENALFEGATKASAEDIIVFLIRGKTI